MAPEKTSKLAEQTSLPAYRAVLAVLVALLPSICRAQITLGSSSGISSQYAVSDVGNLLAIFQGGQKMYNISIQADLHLNQSNWPSTIAINTTVFLRGGISVDAGRKYALDFGDLVNAIQVLSGATLGTEDLIVTGFPWRARGTSLTAGLPDCETCFVDPSVILFPNSTLISNNTEFDFTPVHYNVTCEEFSNDFGNNAKYLDWTVLISPDGQKVTLISDPSGPLVAHQPVLDTSYTDGPQTVTTVTYGNLSLNCYDTPEDRPHALNSDIKLDQLSPSNGESSGQGNLSGGAVAGVVLGAIVGAVLVAVLGFFVLKRMHHGKAQLQSSQDVGLIGDGTSTTGSQSASSKDRQTEQWNIAKPIWQLEAAASQMMSRSSYTSKLSDNSSVGQLSGSSAPLDADGCTLQFDWHIPPHRLKVSGGREAKPLGIGAYGVVYKGIIDGFKPVAIKFLHPATCPIDAANTARFMAEVNLMRACRDRNIVNFIGAWVQQDLVYMVLELMESDLLGANANEQIRIGNQMAATRQLGWYNRGSTIALDILQGLYYLHSNNVIHLDVKSANILLAQDGTAKIADVGLSRTLSRSTWIHHHRGGTLAWQSPEMLMGEPASFSADMWSFGVILLEIVTGVLPERGQYASPEVPRQSPSGNPPE
ncbi:hypothetical protein WJX73_010351 [Symbiochloris irregularis]|uniref:Protein kinase domain-containing protein n=1 Tax=Symbiochloris irregularis TaxID=706552 RepID=A0AAW1NUJ1_9CHLO